MSGEYIKREDAIKRIGKATYMRLQIIKAIINTVPYADVDEVVRCKDCIWKEDVEPGMVYCSKIVGGWVKSDFYCADGKRRKI